MNNVELQKGDIIEFRGKEYEVYAVNPTHRTYGDDAGHRFTSSLESITIIDENDFELWVPQYWVKFVRRPNETATVLADENLGGVVREYREVRRKARAGEYVKIVNAEDESDDNYGYDNGEIYETKHVDADGPNIWPDGTAESEIFLNDDEYVVLESTDIIRIDGARYRMVERNAEKGERIIVVAIHPESVKAKTGKVRIGDIFTVRNVNEVGDVLVVKERKACGILSPDWEGVREYRVLEPVYTRPVTEAPETSSFPSDQISQIIARLERRIDALERKLDDQPSAIKPAPKRRSRDEIIAQAKADVAELESHRWGDGKTFNSPVIETHGSLNAEYVVNRKKRTVVCLLRDRHTGNLTVRSRGIAKCNPSDIFNVHIGKAIALRRALRLPIPDEYVSAPHPTEAFPGDVVSTKTNPHGFIVGSHWSAESLTDQSDFLGFIDDSRTGTEREDYSLTAGGRGL